jgi:hypothetical protein
MSANLYLSLRDLGNINDDNKDQFSVRLYKKYSAASDLIPIKIEDDVLDKMFLSLNDKHYLEFDLNKLDENDIFVDSNEHVFERHCLKQMKNKDHFKIKDAHLHIDGEKIERKLAEKEQLLVKNQPRFEYHYKNQGRNKNYCKPDFVIYDKLTKELIALEFKSVKNSKWLDVGIEQSYDYLKYVDRAYIVTPYGREMDISELLRCQEYQVGLLLYPSKYELLNFLSIFDKIIQAPKSKRLDLKLKKSFLKKNFDIEYDIKEENTDYEDIRELISEDRFPLVDSAYQGCKNEINHKLEIEFARIYNMIDSDHKEMLDKYGEYKEIVDNSFFLKIERKLKKLFKKFS